jgi:hypothetical protein
MTDAAGLRTVANWVTLGTPLGLLIAAVAGCRRQPGPCGLTYAIGYRHAIPKGAAFTVGSVVIFREERLLQRPLLLAHEERHATQWAVCVGILGFPLLYALASAWSWILTGDAHSRNAFERLAGLADGGYRERPLRWARSGRP